jgi:SAM-dependent methyltransferase
MSRFLRARPPAFRSRRGAAPRGWYIPARVAGRENRFQNLEDVRSYYRRILPFYELETAARSDLDFWRRQVRSLRPGAILELGAGLGRVLAAVAPEAPSVVGVDVSFEMLSGASSRLGATGRALVGGDMRELPFERAFDLVIAPNDPFSHLIPSADRRAALREVARVLARGGRFLLDGLYRTGRSFEHSRSLAIPDGSLAIQESWRLLSEKNVWNARYRYRLRKGKRASSAEAQFTARAWDPADLRRFFSSCGLAVEEVWGSFSEAPFTKESGRLIVLARPARFVQRKRAPRSKE